MTLAESIFRQTGLRVTVQKMHGGTFIDSEAGCAWFPAGAAIADIVRSIQDRPTELPLFESRSCA